MPEEKKMEDVKAPASDDKTGQDGTGQTPPPKEEPKMATPPVKEATMGDITGDAASEQKMVPESAFLELKKQGKEQAKAIKELERKIAEGASSAEVSDDLAAIGEEFNVDKNFLAKLSSSIKAQSKAEAEAKMRPIEERDRVEKIDTAFNKHFKIALERMPEFASIVNADVIKTLSLDPKNSAKTFSQIIEETYGSALKGRRTMDATTPGGGKDNEPLDIKRARKDPAYFDEVMANPKLKAEYNANLLKEGI